jgi:hypothetical protein
VDAPILPIGPLLAVLIVLAMVGGWPAIKGLLCKDCPLARGLEVVCAGLRFRGTHPRSLINLLLGAQRVAGIEVPGAGQMAVRLSSSSCGLALAKSRAGAAALPRLLVGRSALAPPR